MGGNDVGERAAEAWGPWRSPPARLLNLVPNVREDSLGNADGFVRGALEIVNRLARAGGPEDPIADLATGAGLNRVREYLIAARIALRLEADERSLREQP